MALQVVGAGLGRTGTTSLKAALEQLLGGPCHHMLEVFAHLDTVPTWHAAVRGEAVDWAALLDGYRAIVDWPGAAFWPWLAADFPDAVVVLSTRDPQAWYASARGTIFGFIRQEDPPDEGLAGWHAFIRDLFASTFTLDLDDEDAVLAAYEAHNAAVRAAVPADRLLEWTAADGWEPLCDALDLPVPDEPFPRLNTSEEWADRH